MHANIEGKDVYIVEFKEMPELPITGLTPGEESGDISGNAITYGQALHDAVETEIIKEPGRYAIYIVPGSADYEIYRLYPEEVEEANVFDTTIDESELGNEGKYRD